MRAQRARGEGSAEGAKAGAGAVCVPPAGPAPRSRTGEAAMREGGGLGVSRTPSGWL